MTTQYTVIALASVADALASVADAVALEANRTVSGSSAESDSEDYVPDEDVPEVSFGAGVPLIGADDPEGP